MAIIQRDFKEFLRLLEENSVRYLLVGVYAVGYYGYPRFTADIDIWIAVSNENAVNTVAALKAFGFNTPDLTRELFLQKKSIIRMGIKPNMIVILTEITGVEFNECYARKNRVSIDGVFVDIISLEDLKKNKLAAGRAKDMADLEYLQ